MMSELILDMKNLPYSLLINKKYNTKTGKIIYDCREKDSAGLIEDFEKEYIRKDIVFRILNLIKNEIDE